MNGYAFSLAGAALVALPSGALLWPERRLLAVSDLHLGKSDRAARAGAALLPPYETEDTLARLDADIAATVPATVICLGDSFDDCEAAASLAERHALWLARLQAGRRWLWIEGNHDPGPLGLSGSHLVVHREGPLVFRHIARPGETGEVSGHFHPKAPLGSGRGRPCFLLDASRLLMPAYGTYTGGLRCDSAPLSGLMGAGALALLTGRQVIAMPMPRSEQRSQPETRRLSTSPS